jgi:hypothetical protein
MKMAAPAAAQFSHVLCLGWIDFNASLAFNLTSQ